jgi:ATP-binding cassette subfamily B (MDR/TAP) protein 1
MKSDCHYLQTPPIDAYSKEGKKIDNIKGKVEFHDVHFRYPSRPEAKVLQGATFTVEPGQTVALVGHSGCGKSTSVGLLTRLYEAEAGMVTIDGQDVTTLNINWLRNNVGIVQQEPILFNATVEENVRIGNPEMSQEEVIRVCRMANAHDFIRKLAHVR